MNVSSRGASALCLFVCLLVSGSVGAKPKDGVGGGPGGGNGGETSPVLSFASDRSEYALGERAQLSWASEGTRFCNASGDWEGKFDTAGVFWTPPLDGPKTYYLKCAAKGGGVDATVSIALLASEPAPEPLPAPEPAPEPAPIPAVSLSAADAEVVTGGSTTLIWSASDADSCDAVDGWAGSYGPSGSEIVGPIENGVMFSMSCTGPGGTASASVMVSVLEPAPAPEPVPEPEPEPEPEPAPLPTVAFDATATEIAAGGRTTLTWSSTDADSCQAGGGWGGILAANGSQEVGPIYSSTTYTLSCSGAGGTADGMTSVTVVPAPTVSFSSSAPTVPAGDTVTLSWSSTHADGCQASGGWSGDRSAAGSETVGPLDRATTFTLSCSGTGGSAMQMVSVSAQGEVTVSWVPPKENVDGSPLMDLERFRIYYGSESRSYTNSVEVTDPNATSHAFPAASGDYFVTMTAVDADGNESAYANEILRSVP